MSKRVLVTCKQMQVELHVHRARLEAAGYDLVVPELRGQQFTATELGEFTPGVVGMIAGDDELSRQFFDLSPDLRVLIRWGIGMDSVDFAAAADHSVVVRNTPGVFNGEVADAAFGFILLLARAHHTVDSVVRGEGWIKHEGISLSGSTIGIVGLGGIGRAVADRARGFGMDIAGYDPYVDSDTVGFPVLALEDLLARSRFVVLTCPSTPETFHLINAETLAAMGADSFLVNVARGPVVDEAALVTALTDGVIAGAGLDVFEVEPLPLTSGLRGLSNVILGSHNGSNTREGVRKASASAVDYLLEELAR